MVNYCFLWCVNRMNLRTKSVLALMLLLLLTGTVVAGSARADDFVDYFERGEFALNVRKWDSAITSFTKAIAAKPEFFLSYFFRAMAYSKKGEYDKSLIDLKKTIQLNPKYPNAYVSLGLVYEIKGDYAAAAQSYQRAIANEKQPEARAALKKYLSDAQAKLKKK
jgi:tetratricopeptide (TPR) repeat protein